MWSPPSHYLLLLSSFLLSLHQTTALVLPSNTHKNLTVESVVQSFIDRTHRSSDPHWKQSAISGLILDSQSPHCSQDDHRSSNISEFHGITLFVDLARPPQPHAVPDTWIIRNQYPEHWDRWNYPFQAPAGVLTAGLSQPPSPVIPVSKGIPWKWVQDKMPVEKADRLLKAAGLKGAYSVVSMFPRWDDEHSLQWRFDVVDGQWTKLMATVDVLTGEVKPAPRDQDQRGSLALEAIRNRFTEGCAVGTS